MCLPKSVLHIKHPQITKTGKEHLQLDRRKSLNGDTVYMSYTCRVTIMFLFFEKNVDLLLIGPNDKSEEQCWEHGLYVSRLVHRCYLIKW